MEFIYILKKDIINRVATKLVFNLTKAKGDVFFIVDDRGFNGKSLLGVLNSKMIKGKQIIVKINNLEDRNLIEETFQEVI